MIWRRKTGEVVREVVFVSVKQKAGAISAVGLWLPDHEVGSAGQHSQRNRAGAPASHSCVCCKN